MPHNGTMTKPVELPGSPKAGRTVNNDAAAQLQLAMTPRARAQARKPSPSLDALNGAKGISALFIVLGHILLFWDERDGAWPWYSVDFLSSVSFFLVTSGFTLALVYGNEAEKLKTTDFVRRRWARLARMYYVGLLLATPPLVIYKIQDGSNWLPMVALPLLRLQSLVVVTGNEWNGPLWTASMLLLCYALLPAALRRLRRLSNKSLLLLFAAISALSLGSIRFWIGRMGIETVFFPHVHFLFRAPHFYLGVVTGLLSQRIGLRYPTLLAEGCSAILLLNNVACAAVAHSGGKDFSPYLTYMAHAEFLLPPVMALWVWALSCSGCSGPSRWVLTCRLPQWLGNVSYSLYCTHWPALHYAAWAVAGTGISFAAVPSFQSWPMGVYTWQFFAAEATIPLMAACVAAAWAFHCLIERPASSRAPLR